MTKTTWGRAFAVLGALGASVLLAATARADDPATDFEKSCYGCHTIGGGPLQGPDLKGIEARVLEQGKDRAWLVRWITDPSAVLDSGDAYATGLLEKYRNIRMPNVPGMSKQRAELLLDLIAEESLKEKSRFPGIQVSMRPFTQVDVDLGRSLFLGNTRLGGGGAACVACHHVGGLGGFGGGRLGPDLTKVFERYEDRRKLVTWLSAPATVTMQPTFREHPMDVDAEILPLVAYFERASRDEQEEESSANILFMLLGFGGTAVCLILFNRLWAWRFRAVRKPLLSASSWKGRSAASSTGGGDRT